MDAVNILVPDPTTTFIDHVGIRGAAENYAATWMFTIIQKAWHDIACFIVCLMGQTATFTPVIYNKSHALKLWGSLRGRETYTQTHAPIHFHSPAFLCGLINS